MSSHGSLSLPDCLPNREYTDTASAALVSRTTRHVFETCVVICCFGGGREAPSKGCVSLKRDFPGDSSVTKFFASDLMTPRGSKKFTKTPATLGLDSDSVLFLPRDRRRSTSDLRSSIRQRRLLNKTATNTCVICTDEAKGGTSTVTMFVTVTSVEFVFRSHRWRTSVIAPAIVVQPEIAETVPGEVVYRRTHVPSNKSEAIGASGPGWRSRRAISASILSLVDSLALVETPNEVPRSTARFREDTSISVVESADDARVGTARGRSEFPRTRHRPVFVTTPTGGGARRTRVGCNADAMRVASVTK
jgi:hypothetical protein|tara:strand:- start:4514 stop:5428 length:915 start_codon:yes stop_codon:yes gene_type:complete|mmetsp:Transcript_8357/g.27848  ORF Transcript_8357/g.27848 Transcript_8357/m.27848 type:complete len:305 (+) Transcript_8357:1825-2739(+)